MTLGRDDLVLGYMTMTRNETPADGSWRFTNAPFEDRCAAAVAGGFAALGIVPSVYEDARAAGLLDADLRAMLRDAGLVVSEVEMQHQIPGPSRHDELAAEVEYTLSVAAVFDAPRIFVVGGADVPPDELVGPFGWICDRCAQDGRVVALEFMQIPELSQIPDARTALRVVEAAGHDNGGLKVDIYHQINGSNDWSQLEEVPGDRVICIELNDFSIPRVGRNYLDDTMHHRLAPGEGDADVVRFVQTMDAIGATCPYTLEVISDELVALPAAELGERLGNATRRVFDAARG
jgi:sugar phosphate isomerase/epimerase